MRLFGKKKIVKECAICGQNLGIMHPDLADGKICNNCASKCSKSITSIDLHTVDEIKRHIKAREENKKRFQSFNVTDLISELIWVNDNEKIWCCPNIDRKNPDIFNYSDIIEYELIEDGKSIAKGGHGAICGNVLCSENPAIEDIPEEDTVNSLSIRISVKNEFISNVEIKLIRIETKRNSTHYKLHMESAKKIISLLDQMTYETKND